MTCPFCRSALNPGADTCAQCGAYEQLVPDSNQIALKVWVPVAIALGVVGTVLTSFEDVGQFLAIPALVGLFFLHRTLRRRIPPKSIWHRRGT